MDVLHVIFMILHMEFLFSIGSCFDKNPYRSLIYATEGDRVHLLCNITITSSVWWKYHQDGKDLPRYISMGGSDVISKYQPRFKLDSETYKLTIYNVSVNDSGLYICVDDDGFGQTYSTLLTVGKRNDSVSPEHTASGSDSYIVPAVLVVVSCVITTGMVVIIIVYCKVRRRERRPKPDHVECEELNTLDRSALKNIERVRKVLGELVEPDYELLDHLISLQVLTDRECSDIRGKDSVHKRTDLLLDIIVTKTEQQCRHFLDALTRSDQQHVVNYIQHPNDTAERYGDVRPLEKSQLNHIDVNLSQLIELIDCNVEVLTRLVNQRSITRQQKNKIDAIPDLTEKNRKLMEILKRKSVAQLEGVGKCLVASKQGHLAQLILEKGVIVNIDAKMDETSGDDVSEAENQIVSRFTSLLSGCDDNRKRRVMSLFENLVTECDVDMKATLLSMLEEFQDKTRSLGEEVDLVGLKKQNSIGSYFFCRTGQALERLHYLHDNGELRHILELIFALLLRASDRAGIQRLEWMSEDCMKYFTMLPGSSTFESEETNEFQIPIEMLEMLLMKTFVVIFIHHLRTDGMHLSEAEPLAYRTLSSVCSDWRQTLNGWPQSNTKQWVKHRLQRYVTNVCRPYRRHPQLVKQLNTRSNVMGVTQMGDKIFVVCELSDTIQVFGLYSEQLEDVKVEGLEGPQDIVACSKTRSLYVADYGWESPYCVWRVSTEGLVDKFTTSAFRPRSLSVTSGRLLVTTRSDVLSLYGADGVELKGFSFTDMSDFRHAVETSRGTFAFCHIKPQRQVVEFDIDGRIISVFNNQQQLTFPCHMSFDSEGKIFIADYIKHHILLLTSDLQLDRVLLDTEHNQLVKCPRRLFCLQQTRHLLVASYESPVVQVFAVG